MAGRNIDEKLRCSFCNKTQDQVKKLIAGHNGVYICDECVEICSDILDEEFETEADEKEVVDGMNIHRDWILWREQIAIISLQIPYIKEELYKEKINVLYLSSGTWSLMGTELLKARCDEKSQVCNFTNEGGYDYRFRYLKNIMGLWIIQSVRHEFGDRYTFAELCKEAEETDYITSRIDVNNKCFLAPENMTEAIKSYCNNNDLIIPDTAGEIAAVVYKSLADSYADTVMQIEKNLDITYDAIYVIGGGANAGYLNQLTADSTGTTEATAIGNIMAQMIADSVFKNLKEARACVRDSFDIKRFEQKR